MDVLDRFHEKAFEKLAPNAFDVAESGVLGEQFHEVMRILGGNDVQNFRDIPEDFFENLTELKGQMTDSIKEIDEFLKVAGKETTPSTAKST